ncbi:MAG TPA: SMP-30/gluconolactonase/LRE family protein [Verrucomicrobiae bacterium]|nr:SMP-30/gluconolactonase/LRE family protein [Verrucomicrobiae bacterium]
MRNTFIEPFLTAIGIWAFGFGSMRLDAQSPVPPPGGIDNYKSGPDSMPQPGVPKGKTFWFKFANSKIFPGTSRIITVYVPAKYKGDKPACVYMGLDGLGFDVPIVFDNLIYKGQMPVTIAIGVSPGGVVSVNGKENPRFNRSFEFDSLDDSLARCIVGEIFPAVEKHLTPDGLPIKLSRDPNDHCAGGGSTGGIGAFTLAWERPDLFRRVFSAIGTFVCMRGGDRYPVLVRETEPKPLRVFQQDGSHDEAGIPEVGDWWMSNQTLERALDFAGYDHQHVWGTGSHNAKQATAVFPDAMRYLWKDWPNPVLAHPAKTQNVMLKAILDPSSAWQAVSNAGVACDYLAVNPRGEIFFHDMATQRTRKFGTDGKVSDAPEIPRDKAFAFAADGHVITVAGINATYLTVTSSGLIYATDADAGKVWIIQSDGTKTLLDEGLKQPTGIALSPDDLWLVVMESRTHCGYSYRVKLDGTVDLKQQFYWVHVPDWADDSGAGGMCMDRDGRLYVATRMGVQVFDRNGRSRGILPMPVGEATNVCFGGTNFDTLFVTSGGKLYLRHMKAVGVPAFTSPIKLPPWGAY